MTDQANPEQLDKLMDDRMRELFPSRPTLAPDFEQRVMLRVQSQATRPAHKRRRGLIMMAYWVLFGLVAGWVISDSVALDPKASGTAMSALTLALALVIASMLILGRQSRLKISRLFLETVV